MLHSHRVRITQKNGASGPWTDTDTFSTTHHFGEHIVIVVTSPRSGNTCCRNECYRRAIIVIHKQRARLPTANMVTHVAMCAAPTGIATWSATDTNDLVMCVDEYSDPDTKLDIDGEMKFSF